MRDTYSGEDLPIIKAEFSKTGDTLTFWTEYIASREELITLAWYEFMDPIQVANQPFENPGPTPRSVQSADPRPAGPDDAQWQNRPGPGCAQRNIGQKGKQLLSRALGNVDHPVRPRMGGRRVLSSAWAI